MKHFYLLKLQNNSNTVLLECKAETEAQAIEIINGSFSLRGPQGNVVPIQLNSQGYRKGDPQVGDSISYCIAVRHENCQYL